MVQTASDAPKDARPLRDQLGVPERVQTDFISEDGLITVLVDAAVTVPEVTAAPVLSVSREQLSQGTVSRFFDMLCGDMVMYSDVEEDMSRTEIEEGIQRSEDFLEMGADTLHEESAEQVRGYIKLLKQRYSDAPLTIADKPVSDGTLKPHQEFDYVTMEPYMTYESVRARNGNVTFTACNDSDLDHLVLTTYNERGEMDGATIPQYGAYIHYYNGDLMPFGYSSGFTEPPVMLIDDESVVPSKAKGILRVTPAQARRTAESLIAGTDMAVSDIRLTSFRIQDEWGNMTDTAYLYSVYCTRVLHGVPCAVMDSDAPYSWPNDDGHRFEITWEYERCILLYGNDGIADFEWCAPMGTTSVLTERADLLPFSEIMDTFTHMTPVVLNSWAEVWGGIPKMEASINRVVFCLQRMSDQAHVGEGVLVPVWNFYGDVVFHWDDEQSGMEAINKYPQMILSVNAINGNIMRPDRGY